jgi:hypothetical protein
VVVASPVDDEPDEDEPDEEDDPPGLDGGKPPELRGIVNTGGRDGAVPTGRVGCGATVDATGVDEGGGVDVGVVAGVVTVALIPTPSVTAGSPTTP